MSDKKQKRVLGRGLDALLGNSNDNESKLKPPSNVNSLEIDINNITITAEPADGNYFDKWSNGWTANPLTFKLNVDMEITAEFKTD